MRTSSITIIIALALAAVACGSKQAEKPRTGPLYQRVGGQDSIHKLVASVATALEGDEEIGPKVLRNDSAGFRKTLADYICHAVKGPCKYTPEQMAAFYEAAAMSNDEFDAFLEFFVISMNEVSVPTQEQNDLIETVEELRGVMVRETTAGSKPGTAVTPEPADGA